MTTWGEVNLFTRPRRLGKTLNMDMLKTFFEIGTDPSLFEGLAISKEKELCEKYMGKFPVISISLKSVDGSSFEDALAKMSITIRREARRFQFLMDSDRLSEIDREALKPLYAQEISREILFGAQDNTLTLAREYVLPIKFAIPFFLFNQMLAAYLRNDKNPALATGAVLAGGIFNIFGDYFFVFACDMGAFGAGLATAIGSMISFLAMLSHFFTKKNTLGLVKPERLVRKVREITAMGFFTFFIDVAMGILTILFNRQIMVYLGTNALSVYGVIVNISTFVQCCAYSVGQASQPIISTNYGAGRGDRIKKTLKYALGTVAVFSILWTVLSMLMPNAFIRVFMSPTEEVLRIAPSIIRCYAISFLLLPLNIFSTYYFQALMKPKAAPLF